MKVLVTGATGFTGGHLARRLHHNGDQVRALVRPATDATALERLGIEVVRGDIRDASAVDQAVRGVDQVFHVAAAFRVAGQPDCYYREVHVEGTRHVLDAARRHYVERVLHCSTVGVHGDTGPLPVDENAPFRPGDIYQQTKLEGEMLAARAFASGQRGVIVRPGGIYGPGDTRFLKLFRAIQRGYFVMLGTGAVQYQLVYIDDLVQGMLECARRKEALGRTYILTGERSITLNELVRLVSGALEVKVPRARMPLWPVLAAAHLCEAVCRPLGISPPLYPRRADFFHKERTFKIDRARRELGFSPAVPPEDGLRRTAAWYLEQGLLRSRTEQN